MSHSTRPYRQYLGLSIVIIAYVGGILGWSWAALSVESNPSTSDSAHVRVEPRPSSVNTIGE